MCLYIINWNLEFQEKQKKIVEMRAKTVWLVKKLFFFGPVDEAGRVGGLRLGYVGLPLLLVIDGLALPPLPIHIGQAPSCEEIWERVD